MARTVGSRLLTALLTATLFGSATAADRLPDRRAVRPPLPGASTAPTAPATHQGMVELLSEMETVQAQMRNLRGQLEVLTHELEQLKNRQHQQMIDIDKRLRELERRGVAAAPAGEAQDAPTTIVTPPVSTGSPTPRLPPASRAPASASEQQQYDGAFALMKQGQYERAATAFRDLIARNPKGALADNAQYWVGELAYVMRDFRTALDEFNKVLTNYPQSVKVPDALLKIGYTHYELGATAEARDTLNQVIKRFPNTTVAKAAEVRLEKIGRDGR